MQYCTECGNLLEKRQIDGYGRFFCPLCDKIYYQNPLPVVAAVITNENEQILLTKRAISPGKGEWALLAGFVEIDESPPQAILREVKEEIGVKGKLGKLIGVYEGKTRIYGPVIVIGYKVLVKEQNFSLSEEIEEIKFFSPGELPPLAFSSHEEILNDLWRIRPNPVPTVDVIVEREGGVVLIKRKNPPYGWALPGGFVEYRESLEEAARREIKEETNLQVKELRQFHTYSDPARDPRFHTITTVFIGKGEGEPKPADDAQELKILKRNTLPSSMAFDHKQILEDYFNG